jgi:hypothetical protein
LAGDEQKRGDDEDREEDDYRLQGSLWEAGEREDPGHVDGNADENQSGESGGRSDLCSKECVPDCRAEIAHCSDFESLFRGRGNRSNAQWVGSPQPSCLIEETGVMTWLRCPNCGESCKNKAKFCPNCGAALKPADGQPGRVLAGPVAKRPTAAFILSVVAVVGLIVVALSMAFIDDAPGDIGSPVAGLFHSVGTVQFILGLGVLTAAIFLVMGGNDIEMLGSVILALGVVSIASLLLVVAEGTFAVIFLAIPGLLAVAAGLLARRTASSG